MSEKKQTAAAENTAAAEKTGPVVYCGPSVKNTVKQFTVYSDGGTLPDAVNDFLNKIPAARGLMVPIADFANTRAALENPKSGAGIIFAAVKAALN